MAKFNKTPGLANYGYGQSKPKVYYDEDGKELDTKVYYGNDGKELEGEELLEKLQDEYSYFVDDVHNGHCDDDKEFRRKNKAHRAAVRRSMENEKDTKS